MKYICHDCKKEIDIKDLPIQCSCGGMLDLKRTPLSFSKEDIVQDDFSLFRYRRALSFLKEEVWREVSLGEGLTPILPLNKGKDNLLVKVDYMMPTLSFKDRGAAVLMAKAKELGVKRVIQDSSGNAGTAIAAYASRAAMECHIYVPEGISPKKVKQIQAYGATLHIVKGTREDTAQMALEEAQKGDSFYASHVYNPLFYEGTKTYIYEVYEQLKGNLPDTLVVPVGNGTLLLGIYYGLMELKDNRLIEKIPKIVAVQAEGCAPIYRAYRNDLQIVDRIINEGTMAEGIAIAAPKRGQQILEAIKATNGVVITAPEEKIEEMQQYLAKRGFYVEITTAATFAAYFEYDKEQKERVLLPLCGAGLKSS